MRSAGDVDDRSTLAFDVDLYSFDSLQRAAYRLSDRIAVHINRSGATWVCGIQGSRGGEPSDGDVALFLTHVNDYSLRERIRAETEAVRNLILALAFSGLESSRRAGGPEV